MNRDSLDGITTFYELERPGIETQWIRDTSNPPKPSLRPTVPHIYSVPFIPEVKQLDVNHKNHIATKLKKEYNYTSTPPHCPLSRLRDGLHHFLQEVTLCIETKKCLHFFLFILTLRVQCAICHVNNFINQQRMHISGYFYMMKHAQFGQRRQVNQGLFTGRDRNVFGDTQKISRS